MWMRCRSSRSVYFFDDNYPDLGELSFEKLDFLLQLQDDSLLFFNYIMFDWIDVRHFFNFLRVKAESLFWPFLLCNEKIVNLIFFQKYCPIVRSVDGFFFVLRSRNTLNHHPFTASKYSNLEWMAIDKNDLFRFIHVKFIETIYVEIVCFVEKVFFRCNDSSCPHWDQDKQLVCCPLWHRVARFVKFWDDETRVLLSVRTRNDIDFTGVAEQQKRATFDTAHKTFPFFIVKRHELWNKFPLL